MRGGASCRQSRRVGRAAETPTHLPQLVDFLLHAPLHCSKGLVLVQLHAVSAIANARYSHAEQRAHDDIFVDLRLWRALVHRDAHGAMEQILSARKSRESTDRAAHRVAAGADASWLRTRPKTASWAQLLGGWVAVLGQFGPPPKSTNEISESTIAQRDLTAINEGLCA